MTNCPVAVLIWQGQAGAHSHHTHCYTFNARYPGVFCCRRTSGDAAFTHIQNFPDWQWANRASSGTALAFFIVDEALIRQTAQDTNKEEGHERKES